MAKVQQVKFENIQDFLNFLPKHELDIVQRLRSIVLACFPNPIEKLSYNVPYYYQHSRVFLYGHRLFPGEKYKRMAFY